MCNRSLVSLFLVLWTLAALGGERGIELISLEQAMRYSVASSSAVEEALEQAELYAGKRREARDAFFPSFGSSDTEDEVASGEDDSVEQESRFEERSGLRLEQPIFSRNLVADYASAARLQASYEYLAEMAELEASLETGLAYLRHLAALRQAALLQAAIRQTGQHRNYARSRINRGVGEPDELERWQELGAARQGELEQQLVELGASRLEVEAAMDRMPLRPWQVVDIDLSAVQTGFLDERLTALFADKEAFGRFRQHSQDWAAGHLPALRAARARSDAVGIAHDPPWYMRVPGIHSYATYGGAMLGDEASAQTFDNSVLDETNWMAGLMFSATLGITEQPEESRRLAWLRVKQEQMAEHLQTTVAKALDDLWAHYTRRQRVEPLVSHRREAFEHVRELYLRGEATMAELAAAQGSWYEVQVERVEVHYEYLASLLRYQFAIGWFACRQPAEERDRFVEAALNVR